MYCSEKYTVCTACAGENAIIIVKGANLRLTEADISAAYETISTAKVLTCQLEIAPEISLAAMKVARKHNGEYLRLSSCITF